MQTLVVRAGRAIPSPEERAAARGRVESHYTSSWARPPTFRDTHTGSMSMLLWEAADSPTTWPAWSAGGGVSVATTYVPLGHERLVGSTATTEAPLLLADALVEAHRRILELSPPFVIARLDAEHETLDVFTDPLGIGRLFEVSTTDGWVWSNRPVAALLYAGIHARPDELGWAQSAAADQFLGATTPYEGLATVDGAAHLHWDGHRGCRDVSVIDVLDTWRPDESAGDRAHSFEEAADSLRSVARSISRLFPSRPVVDLSGGRDSRLVASAFIAEGIDVQLHSHDGVPGDLETARELVTRLDTPAEHRITHTQSGGRAAPRPVAAAELARRWHQFSEGLRPSSFLHHPPPLHLDANLSVVIGGAGGEIAHGYYYPRNPDAVAALPLPDRLAAFAAAVVARHTAIPGSSATARAALQTHVLRVLSQIAAHGVTDATMLDHYYLRERLRRWGTTAERLGTVSPLLSPSFMRAALSLTPAERCANVLHRGITRELVPQWADVPYFPGETPPTRPAGVPQGRPPRILRLADSTDTDELTSLLADASDWAADFDVPHVHAMWHRSVAGTSTAQEEQTLRRVIWAATFQDHLARVRGRSTPLRAVAVVPPGATPRRGGGGPGRPSVPSRLVTGLRRQPSVRAVVRTRLFRAVWHSPVGRRIRRMLDH